MTPTTQTTFGTAIRELMHEHDLTYRQLGDLMDYDPPNLHQILHGQRPCSQSLKLRLIESAATAFQLDPAYFFEYRLHTVIQRIEADPVLEQRVYRQLAA